MIRKRKYQILIFLLMLCGLPSYSQLTKIMGSVIDKDSKEAIPFAHLLLKGTTIGASSDFDGRFSIEAYSDSDTLMASFMGYKTIAIAIKPAQFQELLIELQPQNMELEEVVIVAGENPADILMRKLIKNKTVNDKNAYPAFQYEAYNKIQFDANNISENFKNQGILKPFRFIFDNVDTSTISGKTYLPIFLTESISEVFFSNDPKGKQEVIMASKVSGIKNESISQYLGDMIQNVNIYDNYITLFQKNLVSPFADFAFRTYKYYLVDSAFIDNDWCYQLMFRPKRKQEFTFRGNFWIHDTSWAVKKVDMRLSEDINMNFINDLIIYQEFDRFEDKYWMTVKDKLIVDFNIIKDTRNTLGFFGTKTTTYRDFVFGQPKDPAFYSLANNILVDEEAIEKDDDFWMQARHEELNRDEKTIYHMIDTLNSLPVFRTYIDIVKMITTGYYVKGNFEIGPYMSLISFNQQEGTRLRFGGRTSNEFSKRIMIDAHIAYGTNDETFKYGGGLLYMLSKKPRKSISAYYKYDIEQLGQSQNAFREDFLLAGLFRRNPNDKLSLVRQADIHYEHEWFNGFSNTLGFAHRDVFSVGSSKFEIYCDDQQCTITKDRLTTSEISLSSRFAYKEKYLSGEFERISLGAKYPIVELRYGYGIPSFLGSDYEYHRLQMYVSHWFNIGSLGWSKYAFEAGRIWGKLPYPLLKIHEGNETYIFDETSFNMMNYYEFISDRYLSMYYTHHFLGLFLNKIPLMRKLKWREVAFIKGVVGDITKENREYAALPRGVYTLSKPYFEGGLGVENILKFIRIDAIWRLSYLNHRNINNFGVFMSFHFDF